LQLIEAHILPLRKGPVLPGLFVLAVSFIKQSLAPGYSKGHFASHGQNTQTNRQGIKARPQTA
jgi:hypothetical protein